MMTAQTRDLHIAPIRDASRRLVRELGFMKSTLAGTALPPSAVHALVEIGARGSLTSAELCGVLALEKSSVSRMVRKLVEDGELVEGSSDRDGRAKPLSLTAKGEATLAAIDRFAQDQVIAALVRLGPGARRSVLDGLAVYAGALEASRLGKAMPTPPGPTPPGPVSAGAASARDAPAAAVMPVERRTGSAQIGSAARPAIDEADMAALAGGPPVVQPCGRLSGKVCLVTGGGSGIGRAAALRFALEGAAAVVVAGRRIEEGEAVAAELRAAGSEGVFVPADVTLDADVARLVAVVIRQFGRLDVAFNNAGFQERRALLADQDDATYATVFDTNVRALCHCLRHEVAAMLAGGGGSIVNNTSVSGVRNPNAGLSLYAASKAAAITLTRSAAMEYAPRGIRINAVAPGRVVTDMMLASGIADMAQVAAGLPLRRMGRPEEVAAAVSWLVSDEASYVVGHVLCADGGFLAG
jgi:NAD(P)-dependent dehydrogenase (short-subunit alcohol dehydrogenase family)/DNA-binding MarR family transcriptional regulator